MGRKLYVGNLSYDVNDSDLQAAFAEHGTVDSANVIMDRETGRSKGFGFVEMPDDAAAESAIKALNDTSLNGRNIKVNQARPREQRPARNSGGRW